MTKLTISNLSKRFADVVAVDDLSLEIANGELVSFLGPSGCGKTTTLRCIAGFEYPDDGDIRFDDTSILERPPEARNIGMVFQNYALFPHMTVNQNLSFGLEMRKIGGEEARRRIANVLETVQLADLGERYPNQLSGGQRQRVALARAIVIEPSILLLDEPLANIDAKLREEMRFFIRSLQKRVGITTVYVTHDQAEAMVISDRIVVMFKGEIEQIGGPADIYARPTSREVANFIGLSNFVEGAVQSAANGECVVDTPLGTFACPVDSAVEVGARITLLIRPESIRLGDAAAEGAGHVRFSGRVTEHYYLGNMAEYKVVCGNDTVIQVQEEPWRTCAVGDDVWCSFPAGQSWVMHG